MNQDYDQEDYQEDYDQLFAQFDANGNGALEVRSTKPESDTVLAHILDGEPLIAPGSDGIHGVRLANAIHLSSWLGREVPLDFDEADYMSELNARISAEGLFPTR